MTFKFIADHLASSENIRSTTTVNTPKLSFELLIIIAIIIITLSKDRGRVRVWLSAPNMLSKLFVFFFIRVGGRPPAPPLFGVK